MHHDVPYELCYTKQCMFQRPSPCVSHSDGQQADMAPLPEFGTWQAFISDCVNSKRTTVRQKEENTGLCWSLVQKAMLQTGSFHFV